MARTKRKRPSVLAATLARRSLREVIFESDSTYLLKLVLFTLIATIWVKFGQPIQLGGIVIRAIPIGLLVGLLLVRMVETHQLDRKILYAAIMAIGIVTAFLPASIQI